MSDKVCRFRHGHSTKPGPDQKQYRVGDVEILPEATAVGYAAAGIVSIEGDAPKLKKATKEPSRKAVTR